MTQHSQTATNQPSVCIIILNWNNARDTLACLDAVKQLTYPNFSTLVVDNHSADDSLAQIRAKHPQAELLPLAQNFGYTGGNNRGIQHALQAGFDYVWLLNDDLVVAPDALTHLMAAAVAEPKAGILGPKVCTSEDRQTILSAGGTLVNGWQLQQHGAGQQDQGQYDQLTDVDFIMGCAMLVRRDVIEQVGLLEERFFAYEEDLDWCYRTKQAGFRVLYVPAAVTWHPDTSQRDEFSTRVVYYMARNKLIFVRKHQLGLGVFSQVILHDLKTLTSWTLRKRWQNKREQRNALALALLDFFRGKDGRCEWI